MFARPLLLLTVLLREHARKPLSRTEMKAAVMSEHNDRSGKIFKQVLAAANQKLKEVAGLELIPEGGGEGGAADEDGADATQAVPGASQAGASQSQAGPSTQGGGTAASKAKGGLYLLVNRLPEPVAAAPSDSAQIYFAFVEVVLSLLQQSDGVLDEEMMFEYLEQLGLEKSNSLPQQTAIADKVEHLVQKRLVNEAYLRRQKKANDADTWQYVAGSRASASRNLERADEFRNQILTA